MTAIKEAASEFLAQKRVAVTGVSRSPETTAATWSTSACASVATRCSRSTRTQTRWRAIRAYHDLGSIPGGVDAVVIGTRPEIADETMRECAELGIKHVWMHRGPGAGSVSETATEYGRERGISVIDGGCPCMFGPTADLGHKAMRLIFTLTGNVPKKV